MAPPSDALDAGLAKSNRVALATCRKVDDASRDQFDRRIGAFSEVQFSECSLEGARQKLDLLGTEGATLQQPFYWHDQPSPKQPIRLVLPPECSVADTPAARQSGNEYCAAALCLKGNRVAWPVKRVLPCQTSEETLPTRALDAKQE